MKTLRLSVTSAAAPTAAQVLLNFFAYRSLPKAKYLAAFKKIGPQFNRGGLLYRGLGLWQGHSASMESVVAEVEAGTFEFDESEFYGEVVDAVSWSHEKSHALSFVGSKGLLFVADVPSSEVFLNVDDFFRANPGPVAEEGLGEDEVLVKRTFNDFKEVWRYESGKPPVKLKISRN